MCMGYSEIIPESKNPRNKYNRIAGLEISRDKEKLYFPEDPRIS